MHRHTRFPLLAVVLTTFLVAVSPCAYAAETTPQVTEAQSFEIIDQDGNVLASKDPNRRMAMASITKIMTAMVALDSGKSMGDVCSITDVTLPEGAQLAGYTSTDAPTFGDLMRTMLVYSGNDAALNVAYAVAGTEEAFVELMNKKAREIGMEDTHFSNPHGLEEDDHYSCAHDLALMGKYALENYPFIARTVMTRRLTVTVGGQQKTFESTDELMDSYGGLCGIKTGKVEAGTTFLGSSKRHGLQLFSCVLGCTTDDGRFTDTRILMDWAYDEYFRHVSLTRRAWPLRIVSWQDGFWGKLVVTSAWDVSARSYPERDIDYTTTMVGDGELAAPGSPYGLSSWTQDGRSVARAVDVTGTRPHQIPAINIFALPLFLDVSQLTAA